MNIRFEQFQEGLITKGELILHVGIETGSPELLLIGAGMLAEEERETNELLTVSSPELPPVRIWSK